MAYDPAAELEKLKKETAKCGAGCRSYFGRGGACANKYCNKYEALTARELLESAKRKQVARMMGQ
jgi:hypothetical protein